MTGDRKLTGAEKVLMMGNHKLSALETIINSGGEPSLFELAIIEVAGKLEAHTNLLVELGARLKIIEERISP